MVPRNYKRTPWHLSAKKIGRCHSYYMYECGSPSSELRPQGNVDVAEWLRWRPAKPLGFARVSSNLIVDESLRFFPDYKCSKYTSMQGSPSGLPGMVELKSRASWKGRSTARKSSFPAILYSYDVRSQQGRVRSQLYTRTTYCTYEAIGQSASTKERRKALFLESCIKD